MTDLLESVEQRLNEELQAHQRKTRVLSLALAIAVSLFVGWYFLDVERRSAFLSLTPSLLESIGWSILILVPSLWLVPYLVPDSGGPGPFTSQPFAAVLLKAAAFVAGLQLVTLLGVTTVGVAFLGIAGALSIAGLIALFELSFLRCLSVTLLHRLGIVIVEALFGFP
jgi:hypothetical protein